MPILIHVSVVLQQDDHILLVQESKPANYGRWNLPGGHVEVGETIQQGALREAWEETSLQVELAEIVGIYTGLRPPDYHAIRYVFMAQSDGAEAVAGGDILAVRWFSFAELDALPDAALVGTGLRRILSDVRSGIRYPTSILVEPA